MITVKKVLNTSVVLVEKKGKESIVLGKGIGYGKKVGDTISDEDIDQIFLSIQADKSAQFLELINEIPLEFFEMTKEIVTIAKDEGIISLHTNIYLTLSDHLHFAVERIAKNLKVTNRLEWEIVNYYPIEYQIAKKSIQMISDKFSINLPNEEIANIAFHLINAQTDNLEIESKAFDKAKLVGMIVNTVQYSLMKELDVTSVHYGRFITHVRYFVDRLFSSQMIDEREDELYRQMWTLYPNAMEIATKVKRYLDTNYDNKIPNSELAYLGVHINRLIKNNELK